MHQPTINTQSGSGDASTLAAAQSALDGTGGGSRFKRLLPFLGPAFVASVAYVDPGNFATNIQAGSQFGYKLLWVVVVCNLMAMFIQAVSAKLGIASGHNLAELCRLHFSRHVVVVMWLVMEAVAMATDLAEFLGAALGFYLLLGIPLIWGALLAALVTLTLLALERRGFRPLEVAITILVGIIAVSYLVETVLDRPDWALLLGCAVTPRFDGRESVLLAAGILGATVMPHAIFLHSALMQGRIVVRDPERLRRLFRYEVADVTIAMTVAGLVNAAMLVMAASTFHRHGMTNVGSIEQAHLTLTPLLGSAASVVFAISLLASGLSSSAVGTGAGQIIMQGFLQRRVPVWVRRLVTILPALVVIGMGLDPTRTLVVSQVVLSFGLPFAVVPLVLFSSRRDIMGSLVNRRMTTVLLGAVAILIIALNIFLLVQIIGG